MALRGYAHACIDVSDGLIADLSHLLEADSLGAHVVVDRLPLSAAYRIAQGDSLSYHAALTEGDDYELCFCAPSGHQHDIERLFARLDVPATCIGRVEESPGIRCAFADGRPYPMQGQGYQHFGSTS
jgi:thiamine-monophosphate kinase